MKKTKLFIAILLLSSIPANAEVGSPNQEVYYALNDSNTPDTAIDSSGNNKDGTITGGNYSTTTCADGTHSLDVSNDDTEGIGTDPLLGGTSSQWSALMWLNYTGTTGQGPFSNTELLMESFESGTNDKLFKVQIETQGNTDNSDDLIGLNLDDSQGDSVDITFGMNPGAVHDGWNQIAVVFDGNDQQIRTFLNGTAGNTASVEGNNEPDSPNLDFNTNFHIAQNRDGQGGPQGIIDEFEFFNRSLSQTEISDNFDQVSSSTECTTSNDGDGGDSGGSTDKSNTTTPLWETDTPVIEESSHEFCLTVSFNETVNAWNATFEESYPSLDINMTVDQSGDMPDSRCVSPDLRGHGGEWLWINTTNATGTSIDGVWYVQEPQNNLFPAISPYTSTEVGFLLLGVLGLLVSAYFGLVFPAVVSVVGIGQPIFQQAGVEYPWSFTAFILLFVVGVVLHFAARKFVGFRNDPRR